MKIRITILVENQTVPGLVSEHGLSLWIEADDKYILFDTGQGPALEPNARSMGIDLQKTDILILSHGHYDHAGGLPSVLSVAPKAKVYLHPNAIQPKYSQKEKQTKYIGMPDLAKEIINDLAERGRVVWTPDPTEIIPGLIVTGQIPRMTDFEDSGGTFYINSSCQTVDGLLDDQAICLETLQGTVVLLGCAHAGVVNTLKYVSKMAQKNPIHAVVGGMHLLNAQETRIEKTIEALKQYELQIISPLHCTGNNSSERMQKVFADKYVPLKTGDKISF